MGLDVYSLLRGLANPGRPVFGNMNGDFHLPKEPVGFDDPEVESFYRFLRSNGLTVREVPQSYLLKRFPKARQEDAIGYLDGNQVYLATDYRGRELPGRIKRAVGLHELGHYRTGDDEGAAQKEALRIATEELPDPETRAQIVEFGRQYGWLN